VGEGAVGEGLVHGGAEGQAGCVVGDGLLEVLALYGLVALCALGLGELKAVVLGGGF